MMTMTRSQAQALAALVHELRPEWDTAGVMGALSAARERGTAWDVAQAALRAAEVPTNRTPAVIAMAGAHWSKPGATEAAPRPGVACQEPGHGSYLAHNCGACRAEHIARPADPATPSPVLVRPTSEELAVVRAGVAKVRAAIHRNPQEQA